MVELEPSLPHRLGPAHEPRARTQPSKHKQSQSLIACDTCKNTQIHEVMPFRPLSTNAQKSCCGRKTYQNKLEKTQGTNACNNRDIAFLDVPYRFPSKTQYHTLGDTPLYKVNTNKFENDSYTSRLSSAHQTQKNIVKDDGHAMAFIH